MFQLLIFLLEGEEFSTGVPESIVARVFNLDLASILASTACKSAYEQVSNYFSCKYDTKLVVRS